MLLNISQKETDEIIIEKFVLIQSIKILIFYHFPSFSHLRVEEVENLRTPAKRLADSPVDGTEQARRDVAVEDAQDQPTHQTTESLSHLSLSEHEKQVDELAPSKSSFSALLSSRSAPTPRKSTPGRRKGTRHSLPKYDVAAPVIMTLDSLGVARSSTCTALRQYIVEEAKTKKGWDIDGSLIKGMTAKGIPTQSNFSDCGLYLCAYMEKFILDPAGFVSKILQRQMDPNRDMPMMPSEELRSRMRGMIRELHNEQDGTDTQFPIPEVGSILFASQKTGLSETDADIPRSQVQDDSEDELQQDHIRFTTSDTSRSPANAPTPAAATQYSTIAPKRSPVASSPSSDVALPIAHMLAKIDGSTFSPLKSSSGTKEAAITIDDDDDNFQSVSKSFPASKIPISKNDFFDHPSELEQPAKSSAKKPSSSTSNRTRKDEQELSDDLRHRSPILGTRSHESTESVDTQFLQSGKSYNKTADHYGGKTRTTTTTESGRSQDIVVMVPDSQDNRLDKEVEGQQEFELWSEEENPRLVGGTERTRRLRSEEAAQGSGEQNPDPEPDQEILHGV